MRRGSWGWRTCAVATACFLSFVAPAGAQTTRDARPDRPTVPTPASTPAAAGFEGHRIDLAKNWEQAQACIVLRQAQIVECFRTLDQAEARATEVMPQYAAAGYSCSSPLRLFEHSYYGGRQLLFFDRGYWQNLTDYGFNDQLSSYIVGACYTYLAEHTNGVGAFYPGPGSAWSGVPYLSSGWDNRISSLYMA
ncbi:MAG: hypothetical protein QOH36_329 [Actinomycetota bacterium]|jgi:hypothetical protein|nr:hypothetical protein [Actinomycetota bacterium]MEA2972542.1 hypothetical protein [Actinomycetota bacterium]